MSPPIEEIEVECLSCDSVYRDWDRASVDAEMAADSDYMRKVTTAPCPSCGLQVLIDDARRQGNVRQLDT